MAKKKKKPAFNSPTHIPVVSRFSVFCCYSLIFEGISDSLAFLKVCIRSPWLHVTTIIIHVMTTWVQMFRTNDVVSYGIVKTLSIKYGIYPNIFAVKNEQLSHVQKLFTFFSKNTSELDIVLTRTVNILTTNELVKLTMLWTTGPRYFLKVYWQHYC